MDFHDYFTPFKTPVKSLHLKKKNDRQSLSECCRNFNDIITWCYCCVYTLRRTIKMIHHVTYFCFRICFEKGTMMTTTTATALVTQRAIHNDNNANTIITVENFNEIILLHLCYLHVPMLFIGETQRGSEVTIHRILHYF